MNRGELSELRWTVGEYIAYGQQNALDGAWMKQLENASARRHISCLEALKLQIQRQAEVLYANQLDSVDAAIKAISHQFQVSRAKAGRLIMTESAAFSSAAQRDCYDSLGVERYTVVAAFDSDTCELCGDLDGMVFEQSDYEVGLTAPPFHPWCRCCTCPYFEDMEKIGERWTRNLDGSTQKVPAGMTFEEWRKQFVQPKEVQNIWDSL